MTFQLNFKSFENKFPVENRISAIELQQFIVICLNLVELNCIRQTSELKTKKMNRALRFEN